MAKHKYGKTKTDAKQCAYLKSEQIALLKISLKIVRDFRMPKNR